jgi:hypothetical protein
MTVGCCLSIQARPSRLAYFDIGFIYSNKNFFPRPSLKTGTARQHRGASPFDAFPRRPKAPTAPLAGIVLPLFRAFFTLFFSCFVSFSLMNRLASALFLIFFTWASQLLHQIIPNLVSFVDRKSNFTFRQLLNAA